MNVEVLSLEAWENIVGVSPTIFDSVSYARINAPLYDALIPAVISDGKPRFAFMGAIRDGMIRVPGLAPFGSLISLSRHNSIVHFCNAAEALRLFAGKQTATSGIYIQLPPEFYSPCTVNSTIAALLHAGFKLYSIPNYHIDLTNDIDPAEAFHATLAKHLRGMALKECRIWRAEAQELDDIYALLNRNRARFATSLRVPLERMATMLATFPHDLFRLHISDEEQAAAVVFRTARGIAQVIYWGHIGAEKGLMPMLAAFIFRFYKKAGFRIVDMGPAVDEAGNLIAGLARFKEGLGGILTFKNSLFRNNL